MQQHAEARTVLLVEDDNDVRETVADSLREDGYDVRTASNGAEALQQLAGGPPPMVVITDLMMPVMTGWELVARMRQDGRLASVPVVVTSAASARMVQCNAVLSKPLRWEDLTRTLDRLTASPA